MKIIQKITFYLGPLLLFFSVHADSTRMDVQLELAYPDVSTERPIQITSVPDDSGRIFLVLQEGKILVLPRNIQSSSFETLIDLTPLNLIDNAFEEGLLGFVLHPNFSNNGLVYLYHTLQDPKRSVLVEKRIENLRKLEMDDSHHREILSIPQPYWNHNSGVPCFGPDGFLYLSTGDGGKANDPHDHSQNTFSLLGKILRIDVDKRSGDLEYGIPPDNPFFEKPGYREEIWALGLRNPWRIHWDHSRELLFCADVGQHLWEEVNLIEKGGNYGWNLREGSHPFPPSLELNKTIDYIQPVFEYGHDQGTSISGGCVYYGKRLPELNGKYIFGDWGTGKCWALELSKDKEVSTQEITFSDKTEILNPSPVFKNGKPRSPFKPVNFCLGPEGHVFLLDWQGIIYRTI